MTIGFERHDHDDCVDRALRHAEHVCAAAQVRLTDGRRRVLNILLREHRALGAYDILAELAKQGHKAQPPVAYRALEFLVQHGLAHKIERLSAYIACADPCTDHDPGFLICRACDLVAEMEMSALRQGLEQAAEVAGFHLDRAVVEAVGLCPSCRAAA